MLPSGATAIPFGARSWPAASPPIPAKQVSVQVCSASELPSATPQPQDLTNSPQAVNSVTRLFAESAMKTWPVPGSAATPPDPSRRSIWPAPLPCSPKRPSSSPIAPAAEETQQREVATTRIAKHHRPLRSMPRFPAVLFPCDIHPSKPCNAPWRPGCSNPIPGPIPNHTDCGS